VMRASANSARRLSAIEASFLAIERPGLPMHVAAVVMLDAGTRAGARLTVESLQRLIAARLSRMPRFRQRPRFMPFGLARPEWVPVPHLDLTKHVYHHQLPARPDLQDLFDLCGQIHEEVIPRDRPLWQMHLIDGLPGRQALVVKTHHAITDGIGGIELAEVLLEPTQPGQQESKRNPLVARFASATHTPSSWLEALLGVAFTAASGPIALASPFNGRVGSQRVFGAATLSMADVKQVKAHLGVSVDDVLLASVAIGLRRYFRVHRLRAPRAMRAMVPASTRPPSTKQGSGNHVTSVFIDLPLDTPDLPACARRIAISKAVLKTVHAGAGMAMLIEGAGWLPSPLHATVVRIAAALPFANLVLSDVPGVPEPRFLLGHQVLASYPMIPLPGRVGVSIAAISQGGTMGVGVIADPAFVPDPAHLGQFIEEALASFVATLPRAEAIRAQPAQVVRAA
jgi:diacylglycerol O-acyltransferase / wax synthase